MSTEQSPNFGTVLTQKVQAIQQSLSDQNTAKTARENAASQVSAAESALANAKSTKSSADGAATQAANDSKAAINSLIDSLTEYRDSL